MPGTPHFYWFYSQFPREQSDVPPSVVGAVVLLDKNSRSVENQSEQRTLDLQPEGPEAWQDTESNHRVLGAQSG